jgi:hypothetical protein
MRQACKAHHVSKAVNTIQVKAKVSKIKKSKHDQVASELSLFGSLSLFHMGRCTAQLLCIVPHLQNGTKLDVGGCGRLQ